MTFTIIDMPDDAVLQQCAADACVAYWKRDFPLDTDQWYLDLYKESLASTGLPVVVVAVCDGEFVGTASLIADDELPDANESGPWLAAVFVVESYRHQGIGSELVRAVEDRAVKHGIAELFLYTEHGMTWYQSMGWQYMRTTQLSNHDVTVMSRALKLTN